MNTTSLIMSRQIIQRIQLIRPFMHQQSAAQHLLIAPCFIAPHFRFNQISRQNFHTWCHIYSRRDDSTTTISSSSATTPNNSISNTIHDESFSTSSSDQQPPPPTPVAKLQKLPKQRKLQKTALTREQHLKQQQKQQKQDEEKQQQQAPPPPPLPVELSAQELQNLRYSLFQHMQLKKWSALFHFLENTIQQYHSYTNVHDSLTYALKRLLNRNLVKRNVISLTNLLIENEMAGLDIDLDQLILKNILQVDAMMDSLDIMALFERYSRSVMQKLNNDEKMAQVMLSLIVQQMRLNNFCSAQMVYSSMKKMGVSLERQQIALLCSSFVPYLRNLNFISTDGTAHYLLKMVLKDGDEIGDEALNKVIADIRSRVATATVK